MNLWRFSSFPAFLVVGLLAGCGVGAEPTSSESSALALPGPVAAVRSVEIRANTPTCGVALQHPVVELDDAAATAAIAAALPLPSAKEICSGIEEGEHYSVDGGFEVVTNARGILGLVLSESSFMSGASHMANSWAGLTFDLRTGRRLHLRDVLQPTGLATVRSKCADEYDAWACDLHLDESEGPASFTVEREGLRLQLMVPADLLVPWSDVATAVTPALRPFVDGVASE